MLERARARMRAGVRRLLLVGPCGMGKTVLAATMAQAAVQRGKRLQFWCHRKELVTQTVRTFVTAADVHTGIIAAGFPSDASAPAQVCSVQSLKKRIGKIPAPDIIIVDEAHHQPSATYAALAAAYPSAFFIGITASPIRLDGKGLGAHFDEMVLGPSTAELIALGFLSPYRLFAPSSVDMSHTHTVAGDFNRKETDVVMRASSVVGDAVSTYLQHCDGGKALIFGWSIESSELLAAEFRQRGVVAVHVDGETPSDQRTRAMQSFEAGETRVLCSVDLMGEGVDVPSVDAVFLLRPTQSLGVYIQQTGRGLRIAPGKTHVKIFDHANNWTRHGLPDDARSWSLDGVSKARKPSLSARRCPSCFAVSPMGTVVCVACKQPFPSKPRKVTQVDGALVEADLSALRELALEEEHGCRTLHDWQELARKRGFKPGWAWHRWQARNQRRAAILAGASQ